jgi:hypothetical protein
MKITGMLVAGSMLMGSALGAHAQIMKCVGKDGRIEFAQSCPPGTKQMNTGVSSRPAPAPAPAAKSDGKSDAKGEAKPKTLADRDAEFRKRQAEQKKADEKSAKSTADEAERQRTCQAAQSQLIGLRNRQRMFRTDPATGERMVFEEADYQREQAVAERVAAENCK